MIKYFFGFLVLGFSIMSCRKQTGGFQASSVEHFELVESTVEKLPKKEKIIPKTIEIKENSMDLASQNENLEKGDLIKLGPKPKKKKETKFQAFVHKIFPEKDNQEVKKTKKPRRKRGIFKNNTIFNDGFLIGSFFLIIAIILSLLHLPQLVLFFGLGSMIMFLLGFKKYFWKKRIRNMFVK